MTILSCPKRALALLAGASLFCFAVAHEGAHEYPFHVTTNEDQGCKTVTHAFNPLLHKQVYRVGVYASEGAEVAHRMYDDVFANYLGATAGQRFNPPVTFEVVPVSLTNLVEMAADQSVDLMFSSSAVFSCMATEWKAQPLATITNRRESMGHSYSLDMYGGVMATLAGSDIKSIQDFKGRTIGAGAITAMGGGQTQFNEMVKAGLSFVSDPKQVIFVGDERKVVQGLLDGEFEIGFARTDQIERHTDENGEPLNENTFQIINAQTHRMDDGTMFPFMSSTSLHPEWPVAALDHVDKTLAKQVQEALLALEDHAMALELNNETLRCDTTPDLAKLAKKAATSGSFTNFRTPRSYFGVRTKQETAGFLRKDEKTGDLHCIRGDTLYHDIECPDQYYKVSEQEFETSCQDKGLECKEGYECYCQPCVKAYEVDVFEYHDHGDDHSEGCEKMSVCGDAEQTKMTTFRIVDNLKRDNAYVEVIIHLSDHDEVPTVLAVTNMEHTYEFGWSSGSIGMGIMEVFVEGQQIPESPLRIQVVERNCDTEYAGQGKRPASDGDCVCPTNTFDMGHKCLDTAIFAIIGALAGFLILACATFSYLRYRTRKSDALWQVHPEELHFDDPVEVIGEGAFGQVLLAEFRGTKVAVKRAIKAGKKGGSGRTGSQSKLKSRDASRIGSVSGQNAESKPADEKEELQEISSVLTLSSGSGETQPETPTKETDVEAQNYNHSMSILRSGNASGSGKHFSVGFLFNESEQRRSIFPWTKQKRSIGYDGLHQSILTSISASTSRATIGGFCCPWFTETNRLKEEFRNEMRVLAQLRHPCITTVMGAVVMPNQDPVMVMEFMEYGSLYDLLRNETMSLDGEIILQICRDLAQGLRFLHSSKPPILHGDLKARNILVDSRFRAKLCDFGLSTKRHGSISGTPYWLAPEYLMGSKKYDVECDIYSVGIILYEIYSRKSPYEGEDYKDVIRGVCNRRINKRPAIPASTPPKFADLMKKCWSPDVSYRPPARSLDMMLMEMDDRDADPLAEGDQSFSPKKPSGDLLYTMFPKHVADALKNGQKVEPEKHEIVTVIFSDIIKFTDISRDLPPEKVCDMLDRLYVAFDKCSQKHQVFKVETIGDAWMGVTNLEQNQNNTHAKNIALMAKDMVQMAGTVLIDEENPCLGHVSIRVGFHSGPVVSNVIGSLNKRYCLFGDTVNTASRMESNSRANKILCSEASYNLLLKQAKHIKTRSGGKIQVKGKGDMAVYWVSSGLRRQRSNDSTEKRVEFALDRSERSDRSAKDAPLTVDVGEKSDRSAKGASVMVDVGDGEKDASHMDGSHSDNPWSPAHARAKNASPTMDISFQSAVQDNNPFNNNPFN